VDEALELEEAVLKSGVEPTLLLANKRIPPVFRQLEMQVVKRCIRTRRANQRLDGGYRMLSKVATVMDVKGEQDKQMQRLKSQSRHPVSEVYMVPQHEKEFALDRLTDQLQAALESVALV